MTDADSWGFGGSEFADVVDGGVERLGLAGGAAVGSRMPLQLRKAGSGAAAAPPSPESDVATAVAAVCTPETQRLGHDMACVEGRECSEWGM